MSSAWERTGHHLAMTAGRWTKQRSPHQSAWISRRLDPYLPHGLTVTCLSVLAGTCLIAFMELTEDVGEHEGLATVDARIHAQVLAHRSSSLDVVMKTVTRAGSNALLIPLVVVLALAFRRTLRTWRPGAQLVVAYGLAVLAHTLVTHAVNRPRPPAGGWLAPATGSSYPSGHAMQVTALFGTLLLAAGQYATRRVRTLATGVAVVMVLLVCVSRVYLGMHWFTDVLGGLLLSAAVVCLTAIAFALLRRRGNRAANAPPRRVASERFSRKTGL